MDITMTTKISGTRNGQDWPPAGGRIDLPEQEARDLIAAGLAAEVTAPAEPETATPKGRRTVKAADPAPADATA